MKPQDIPSSTDAGPDGNIGVIQTMVGELVKKPEHEREPLLFDRHIIIANTVQHERLQ